MTSPIQRNTSGASSSQPNSNSNNSWIYSNHDSDPDSETGSLQSSTSSNSNEYQNSAELEAIIASIHHSANGITSPYSKNENTDLDVHKTPPGTPRPNPQPPETPSPIKTAVALLVNTDDLSSTLDKRGKANMNRVQDLMTSPDLPVKFKSQRRLFGALENEVVPNVKGATLTTSPNPEARTLLNMGVLHQEMEGSVVEATLKALQTSGKSINFINPSHLTEPTPQGNGVVGFHFCPPDSPHNAIITERFQSPFSDVWFARFTYEGHTKDSSFFPLSITNTNSLLQVIAEGTIIARQANKALLITQTQTPFYFEVCFGKQGLYINTVYPIYYFTKYAPDTTISITQDLTIKISDIKPQLKNRADLIQYKLESAGVCYHILDISSLILNSPISRGIYLQIPEDLL